MQKLGLLINEMIKYYAGDCKRIDHFLKVYNLAKTIGEMEDLESKQQEVLEIAALVHDIGIKASEEKYHSVAARFQEIEGPPLAEAMLEGLGYERSIIKRVCYLVGHHHSYMEIDDKDFQILVEADFLVNIAEDHLGLQTIKEINARIFKTKTGSSLLEDMYLSQEYNA